MLSGKNLVGIQWISRSTILRGKIMSLVAGILLINASMVQAEDYELDWANFSSLPQKLDETARLRLTAVPVGSSLVEASSTPPNPFPDRAKSAHIISTSSQDSWFRQHVRLFEDGAKQGSFVMEFRLGSGLFKLQMGHNEAPWDPANEDAYWIASKAYFNASFQPGDNISIDGASLRTDTVDQLVAGENYILKVSWDMQTGTPSFSFFLNGEPMVRDTGAVFSLRASAKEAAQGVNAIRLSLGASGHPEGEVFLGKISASSAVE